MRTERGLARLVSFSDGVVAIAITLLVLPLVTSAAEPDTDVTSFLTQNAFQLMVFLISFLVIARFWLAHHQMYENVIGYNAALLWANLLWLLSIVFLPFPTELLGSSDADDSLRYGLYIGTMVVTSGASAVQQWVIIRSPDLQVPQVRGTLSLTSYLATTGIMIVALAVAVLFPVIGLWALFLLFATSPVLHLMSRLRKAP